MAVSIGGWTQGARGAASAISGSCGSGCEQGLHLLQRVGLDLADALGADAVLVGQLLQGRLVVGVEPAAADDVARALVERAQSVAQQFELVLFVVGALVGLRRILLRR